MSKIKFYEGTVERPLYKDGELQKETFKREYFAKGDKLQAIDAQVAAHFATEYAEFKDAAKAGKAPQIEDDGDLKIVEAQEPEKAPAKAVKAKVKVKKGEKK